MLKRSLYKDGERAAHHPSWTFCLVLALLGLVPCWSASPILIAGTVSRTGELSSLGIDISHAYELARHYFQDVVGPVQLLSGEKTEVQIVLEDDESAPARVTEIYSSWEVAGVDFFLSPATSNLAAAIPQLNDSTAPLKLACCVGRQELFDVVNPNTLFSILDSADSYFSRMLQVLRSRGARSLLLVKEDDSEFLSAACNEGKLLGSAFGVDAGQQLRMLPAVSTPGKSASSAATEEAMDRIAHHVKLHSPDVVVACVRQSQCPAFMLAMHRHQVEVSATLLSACATDDSTLAETRLPDTSEYLQPYQYVLGATPFSPSLSNLDILPSGPPAYCMDGASCWDPADFHAQYTARYGSVPGPRAARAFAVVQLAVQAALQARERSVSAYRQVLLSGIFSSIVGPLQFKADGQRAGGLPYMQQLPGGAKVVSPDHLAKAQLQMPAPSWPQRRCLARALCGKHGACVRDGTCACQSGYTGDHCGTPVVLLIVAPSLALALIALFLLAAWQRQAFTARQTSLQQAHDQAQRELTHTVTQSTVERTMTYALHELGNPVHIMAGSLELLRESLDKPNHRADTQQLLDSMQRSSRHMRQVLAEMQLQHVHEEEASTGHLQLGHADAGAVLRDVKLRMSRVFGVPTGACLDLHSLPGAVVIDELRVRQLLLACAARLATLAQPPGAAEASPSHSRSSLRPRLPSRLHALVKLGSRPFSSPDKKPALAIDAEMCQPAAAASDFQSSYQTTSTQTSTPPSTTAANSLDGHLQAMPGMQLLMCSQPMRGSPLQRLLQTPVFNFDGVQHEELQMSVGDASTVQQRAARASLALYGGPSPHVSTTQPQSARSSITGSAALSLIAPAFSHPLRPHLAIVIAPQTVCESVLGPCWEHLLSSGTLVSSLDLPAGAEAAWAARECPPAVSTLAHELMIWHVWNAVQGLDAQLPPQAARLTAICHVASEQHMQTKQGSAGESHRPRPDSHDAPPSSASTLSDTLEPLQRQFDTIQPPLAAAGSQSWAVRQAQRAALQSFTMTLSACHTLANRLGGCLHVVHQPRCMALLLLPDRAQLAAESRHSEVDGDILASPGSMRLQLPTQLRGARRQSLSGGASSRPGLSIPQAEHTPQPSVGAGAVFAGRTMPSPAPRVKQLVVVVDDERANVLLTCRRLQKLGYNTARASDGDELLPLLQGASQLPCLILLDIVMKRMDGVTALQHVQAAGYSVPIVAMTANTQVTDICTYAEAGFSGVLRKPFNTLELCQICAQHSAATPAAHTPASAFPVAEEAPDESRG